MPADGEDRRPGAASGSKRLRLHADLLEAQEQARDLRARLERAETEVERAREDLAAERHDRQRDAEWFRQALAELRTAAAEAHSTERTAEELRAALDEARAAVGARDARLAEWRDALQEAREALGARDALLAELRQELDRRVRAESETLSALDALRERAAAEPEPATPPVTEPAPVEEPAAAEQPPLAAVPEAPAEPAPAAPLVIGGRFDRRPPWPEGTTDLARAEIDWQAGYVNSRFRVIVYHPNRKRGTIAATGSNYKWQLMGEPAPDSPEFAAEVERLAAALEDAGWEQIGDGAAWFSRRYVWRRSPPAPDQLRPGPLEAFQRS